MHYKTTGPEIWEQTEGKVTAFVAGAGTGGTISGVGKFLKEKNPNIRVIGADIEGSVLSGDSPKSWKVEGIGEDFVPHTLNAHVVDEWIRVSDAESFHTIRQLAKEEGIMLGGSSGTAIFAGLKYAQRCSEEDLIVVMCPDTGRNYLSKAYDDEWMFKNGFTDIAPDQTHIGMVLEILGREGQIWTLTKQQTLDSAIQLFQEKGISQIPIVEGEEVIGSVEEITIMHALHQGKSATTPLSEVMARPLPVLDAETKTEEVYRLLLAGNPAVIIKQNGRLIGIITRTDLIYFYQLQKQAKNF